MRFFPGRCHPDLVQRLLDLGLDHLGELVEHIGGLMNPATLMSCLRKDLAQCFPKPQCSVSNCQFRGNPESLRLLSQQQLRPALLRFPITILNGNELFPALFCNAYNHKDALLGIVAPNSEIHTVCPDINVPLVLQAAPAPGFVLFLPYAF